MARLVALDGVMPVHASVTGAVAASARESYTLVSLDGEGAVTVAAGRARR
jgi:hypothetical protein